MGRANDDAGIDSSITVHMNRGRVVLRPVGRLDGELIDTVLGLVRSARDAGVVAEVDLEGIEPGERASRAEFTRLMAARRTASSSTA